MTERRNGLDRRSGGSRAAALGLACALAAASCGRAVSTPPAAPGAPAAEGQTSGAAAGQKPGAAPGKPGADAKAASKALFATAADGTRLAYETSGSGPALLLLHGGGQTRAGWKETGYVDRLGKRFTVITMDQRGTGESGKPTTADAYALDRVLADVTAVADAAGAKRFHVWGYGHGATIARYLAARSDRVISAVVVGATFGPAVTGIVKQGIEAMRAKWQPLMEAKQAGTLDLEKLSAGDRTALEGGTPIAALSLGAMLDYPPLEPADIKAPTLWVVGGADTSVMENLKEHEEKLKGTSVTLKTLGSASYSDLFLKIDDVLSAVEPFLTAPAT